MHAPTRLKAEWGRAPWTFIKGLVKRRVTVTQHYTKNKTINYCLV